MTGIDGGPDLEAALARIVQAAVTRPDGAPFGAGDELVLVALAAAAGMAIDSVRLCEEARGRQRWVETVSELTRGLLSGEDVDDVLAALAQRLRLLAVVDLTVIALSEARDPAGDSVLIVAADGAGAERLRGAVVDVEDVRQGTVFASDRTEPSVPEQTGPNLVVPLEAGGQTRGVLALHRRPGGAAFDAATTRQTTDLAMRAAMALELAERRADDGLLSQYADRDRIGRDLQDLAVQRLFATSMSLQGVQRITREPVVADRISQAIADLDDTVKAIRSTSFALQAREPRDPVPGGRIPVAGEHGPTAGAPGFPRVTVVAGPLRVGGQPPRSNCAGTPNSTATRLPHGRG